MYEENSNKKCYGGFYDEVAAMCSDNFESILRLKTKDSVKDNNHKHY